MRIASRWAAIAPSNFSRSRNATPRVEYASARFGLRRIAKRGGEVRMRRSQIGLDADRVAARGDRLFEPAALGQRRAEIRDGLRPIRLALDRLPISRDRLIELTALMQDHSQVEMK